MKFIVLSMVTIFAFLNSNKAFSQENLALKGTSFDETLHEVYDLVALDFVKDPSFENLEGVQKAKDSVASAERSLRMMVDFCGSYEGLSLEEMLEVEEVECPSLSESAKNPTHTMIQAVQEAYKLAVRQLRLQEKKAGYPKTLKLLHLNLVRLFYITMKQEVEYKKEAELQDLWRSYAEEHCDPSYEGFSKKEVRLCRLAESSIKKAPSEHEALEILLSVKD